MPGEVRLDLNLEESIEDDALTLSKTANCGLLKLVYNSFARTSSLFAGRAQSRSISFEVEAAAERELIEMSLACLSSSLLVKLETCQHIHNMHTKALAEAVRSRHSDNLNSYFVQVTLIVKGIMPSTREDKQAVNQSI